MHDILLAYYGDDFTGSTDALEFISNAGAKTVLFIDVPTKSRLQKFPDVNVIGVAGKTRALPTEELELVLTAALNKLKIFGARHIHYKICSTFDSSPAVGSIGKVLDISFDVFGRNIVPILGGAPSLGRYCAFGNLFARMGIGSAGIIYRIDRHPSMSTHPVTPAEESDLRLHLSRQTANPIALLDFIQQQEPVKYWNQKINGAEAVLLDCIDEAQLQKIGEWFDSLAHKTGTLFSIGPSSVENALGNYWRSKGILKEGQPNKAVKNVDKILIVSGSCSPVSARQTEFAKQNGFEELIVDAVSICDDQIDLAAEDVLDKLLAERKSVIVHTGDRFANNLSSEKLGSYLGRLLKLAIGRHNLKRVGVAGGDTSSYAARAMGIEAVERIASSGIGAPLCRAFSDNKKIDGLEVNFKGGQVGAEHYFCTLKDGSLFQN